jgi:uncharacterized RDD family membrane protein YckC
MENPYEPQPASVNLLEEFELDLRQASTGKRFANWLIDIIVFYIVAIIFILLTMPSTMRPRTYGEHRSSHELQIDFTALLIYIVYFVLLETLTKGKTIGKMITGTRAVQEDGRPITFRIALLRTISRIVPFEPFSALGSPSHPWHDRWTDTYVIDEKASTIPAEG